MTDTIWTIQYTIYLEYDTNSKHYAFKCNEIKTLNYIKHTSSKYFYMKQLTLIL